MTSNAFGVTIWGRTPCHRKRQSVNEVDFHWTLTLLSVTMRQRLDISANGVSTICLHSYTASFGFRSKGAPSDDGLVLTSQHSPSPTAPSRPPLQLHPPHFYLPKHPHSLPSRIPSLQCPTSPPPPARHSDHAAATHTTSARTQQDPWRSCGRKRGGLYGG